MEQSLETLVNELAFALEDFRYVWYIHKETHEILSVPTPEGRRYSDPSNGDFAEVIQKIESNPESYYEIEGLNTYEAFDLRNQFGQSLRRSHWKKWIHYSLENPKPFNSFNLTVRKDPDLLEKWHVFKAKFFRNMAIEWLEQNTELEIDVTVKHPYSEGADPECIFCQIIHKRSQASTIYEDESIIAFMDIDPITPGHLVLLPKKHVNGLEDLDFYTATHMTRTLMKINKGLSKSGIQYEGCNIVLNNGTAAGQEVPHLHFHLYPRFEGDGIKITRENSYEIERLELEEQAEMIQNAMDKPKEIPPREFKDNRESRYASSNGYDNRGGYNRGRGDSRDYYDRDNRRDYRDRDRGRDDRRDYRDRGRDDRRDYRDRDRDRGDYRENDRDRGRGRDDRRDLRNSPPPYRDRRDRDRDYKDRPNYRNPRY